MTLETTDIPIAESPIAESPIPGAADPAATPDPAPDPAAAPPRQTLALRLAERSRQRELRAERLSRLRPGQPDPADEAEAALEDFLRALTGDRAPAPAPPPAAPGALLPFQRPETAAAAAAGRPEPDPARAALPPGDLDRLPGIGPGLLWALQRAGLRRLADLAPLAPEELAARLGPIGRLVPARAWVDAARKAVA